MSISYRVNPTGGDTAVEVEPHFSEDSSPAAYLTVVEGTNPTISVLLDADEIAELREVLEKVEADLRGSRLSPAGQLHRRGPFGRRSIRSACNSPRRWSR